eukprot:149528_1
MPRYMPTLYQYTASTQYQLFTKISRDPTIKPFAPYGSYKKTRRNELKPIILKILQIVTGNDELSFINDLLGPMDVALHIYPANQIINDLIHATNTWGDPKLKSNYLQFLSPHFSRPQLNKLDCNCGWTAYSTSYYWRQQNEEITPFSPTFGRFGLSEEVEENVFNFLEQNSRIAANNISLKHETPIRHRN